MGKKQKAKKENAEKKQPASLRKVSGGSRWTSWLIGVVIVLALVIGGMVVFVQANKARFVKLSVLSTCGTLQKNLYSRQANFTRDESTRLQNVLTGVEQLAKAEKTLDVKIGGHLMFVLKVTEEIIQDGQLQAGELEKMEMLIHEAERQQSSRKTK